MTATEQKPMPTHFEEMHNLMAGRIISSCIFTIAKLGIADHLVYGPQTITQLSKTLQVDEDRLYCLMRILSSYGIFAEDNKNCTFSMTPLASTLVSGQEPSLRDLAVMCGDHWHWMIWGDLEFSLKSGKPSFEHLFDTHFFDYLQQNPDAKLNFNRGMSSLSSLSNHLIAEQSFFEDYPVIVDIGGGEGGLLFAILQKHAQQRGILFDLPEAIEKAESRLETLGLSTRCRCLSGDFFQSIPGGGNLYILKHVLHGLDDGQTIALLNSLQSSMPAEAHLVIVEMLVPDGQEQSYSKLNDLGMRLISNHGRERTEHAMHLLLHESGFAVNNVIPLAAMGLHLLFATKK